MTRGPDFPKISRLMSYYLSHYPNPVQVQTIPAHEMKISVVSIYKYSKRLEELGYLVNKGYNHYVWNPNSGITLPNPEILAMQWRIQTESNGQKPGQPNSPAGNPSPNGAPPDNKLEPKDIRNIKTIVEKADSEKGKQELNDILMYHIMQFWRLMGSDNPNFHRSIIEQLIQYNSGSNTAGKMLKTLIKLTELSTEDQIKEALDTLQK